MRVRALRDFRDLEAKADRKAGEVFEASEARAKAINSTKYGMLVGKVAERKQAKADKEA